MVFKENMLLHGHVVMYAVWSMGTSGQVVVRERVYLGKQAFALTAGQIFVVARALVLFYFNFRMWEWLSHVAMRFFGGEKVVCRYEWVSGGG